MLFFKDVLHEMKNKLILYKFYLFTGMYPDQINYFSCYIDIL